ncbi:MAG: glycosyltransferase family 2 protein [Planctomycetota bacterium]|nr:MAG: glycosyltransferase family 2 protein [Planctomycetota bacterium]
MARNRNGHRVLAFAPAFNEENKIGLVVEQVPMDVVDEMLVIDDGSTDRTKEAAEKAGARVVSTGGRTGVGNVIRLAISETRSGGFTILVVMAGNNKDRPAEIPRLIDPIIKSGYDFVQGSRYLPGGNFGNMPFYRQFATRLVHPCLFSAVSGRKITDSTNGFRAMRISMLDDPRFRINDPWLDKYELEPYIFYKAIKLGYRVTEAPVTKIYPPKELGYTKMAPITGWWSILRPLIYLALGVKS